MMSYVICCQMSYVICHMWLSGGSTLSDSIYLSIYLSESIYLQAASCYLIIRSIFPFIDSSGYDATDLTSD